MSRLIPLFLVSSLFASPALADDPRGAWPLAGTPFEMPMMAASGPRLGVGVTDMTEALRLHFEAPADAGVLVSQVESDSAAEEAGVQVGDVIIRFDGRLVSSGGALREAVAGAAGKKRVEVEVVRDKAWKTLKATIAEPEAGDRAAAVGPRAHPWPEAFTGRMFDMPEGAQVFQFDLGDVQAMQQRLDQVEGELDALRDRLESLESAD